MFGDLVRVDGKRPGEFSDIRFGPIHDGVRVPGGSGFDEVSDDGAERAELGFLHSAGGRRRHAKTHSNPFRWARTVIGDRVLVGGDVGEGEQIFGLLADQALARQVDQNDVRIGSAGNDADVAVHQGRGERPRVRLHLSGVYLEIVA